MRGRIQPTSIVILLLFFGGFVLVSTWYLSTPITYKGDTITERDCRECEGAGSLTVPGREDEICPFCGGQGTVPVVDPGPHRPTRITILVQKAALAEKETRTVPTGPGPDSRPPGAVPRAEIRFEQGDYVEVAKTDDLGNPVQLLLPPGKYRVRATARGYEPWTGRYEVPELEGEIWLESAPRTELPATEIPGQWGRLFRIPMEPVEDQK